MRIAHLFRIFVVLLQLSLYVMPTVCRLADNSSVTHPHHHRRHSRVSKYLLNSTIAEFGRWLSPPEAQLLLRKESSIIDSMENKGSDKRNREMSAVDCCPSVSEWIQPLGGKNKNDLYVDLYRDDNNIQTFQDVSCQPGVEGKPCRFMDKKLHNQSSCVQKFSYTYALVKETAELRHNHHHAASGGSYFPTIPGSGPRGNKWMMDHILVRSGCSCVVQPKPVKKSSKKSPRVKSTSRPHHTTTIEDNDMLLQT